MGILSFGLLQIRVLYLRADHSGVITCMLARITLAVAVDSSLLRTDRNGWIQLSTDCEQLWVTVELR